MTYTGTILTYLLTPWCRVLLEQLTGLQLVKKFPTGTILHLFALFFSIICLALLQIVACSASEYTVDVIMLLLDTRRSLGCVLGTSQDLLQSKRKRKSVFRAGFEPAFLSCTRSKTCPQLVWKVGCYWINYMSTVIRENRKRCSHFHTNPVHLSYCARAVAKMQPAHDYVCVWCFV